MNLLAQRSAINKFHRDEVSLIVVPNLEDLRNIRMAQCRRRFSFANETLHPIPIRCDICGKNLQRDFTIELCVLSKIDLAHSARADFGDNTVMRECCVDAQRFAHCLLLMSLSAPLTASRHQSSGERSR